MFEKWFQVLKEKPILSSSYPRNVTAANNVVD